MTVRHFAWILAALVTVSLIGCGSQKEGRIMGEEEQDYVGKDAAGSATYDRLIEEAVTKLLRRQAAAKKGLSQLKVAYLGVENKSAEDLGDFQDQLFELIDTSINKADRFRTISSRFVNEALRETRLRREQLLSRATAASSSRRSRPRAIRSSSCSSPPSPRAPRGART